MQHSWKKVSILGLLLVCFISGFVVARLGIWVNSAFGKKYSSASSKDQWELRRLAYLAYPAINLLEYYYNKDGKYPPSLHLLKVAGYPEYISDTFYNPNEQDHFPVFTYTCHENGKSFVIGMKMNMEDSLFYESTNRYWLYRADKKQWKLFTTIP